MIWEFGKIPLELIVAIIVVLAIEFPFALFLSNRINALIDWIKDHETD